MEVKYADRAQETSTSTGTGDFTLDGATPSYRSFASSFSVGDTFHYLISIGTDWEIGSGELLTTTTFSRFVLSSSNSNALVDFPAGTKFVSHILSATAASNFARQDRYIGVDSTNTPKFEMVWNETDGTIDFNFL